MASVAVLEAQSTRSSTFNRFAESLTAALGTAAVLLIHGYHPYASDASIYVAGLKKAITPSLYANDNAFFDAHMHRSLFFWLYGHFISLLGLPVDFCLFGTYLVLTGLTLFFAGRLALVLAPPSSGAAIRARFGAVLLVISCFSMPVAGTGLLLVDPYVTARSFTTVLTLAALCVVTDQARQSWRLAAIICVAAISLHPLMGVYLAIYLAMLFVAQRRHWRVFKLLLLFGFGVAAILHLSHFGDVSSAAYRETLETRSFLYLAHWRWYEQIGLLAPVSLMALAWRRLGHLTTAGVLALTCAAIGAAIALTSALFVVPADADLLMRVQPLRCFHILYLVGVIYLGGALAIHATKSLRYVSVFLAPFLWAGMFFLAAYTYPGVSHVELPDASGAGVSSGRAMNEWASADTWIRLNTLKSSVFAADPQFLYAQGESLPGFRAATERSILIDIKDEGETSVDPTQAELLGERRNAEQGLNTMPDSARLAHLTSSGATWMLLSPASATRFNCPFRNPVVRVCRLP